MTATQDQYRRLRDWQALKTWQMRLMMSGRFEMGGACCSNPNPQPYDTGNGQPIIKCMNCGA